MGWVIEASIKARSIHRVIVTTDDPEYAAIARAYGAETPFLRPAELASSTATSEAALIHTLNWLDSNEGFLPEGIAFIQATSPLIQGHDLDTAADRLENEGYDVIFSATKSHSFLWNLGAGGNVDGINHDPDIRERRQDRPIEYRETGAFYLMRTNGFLAAGHRFFGNIGVSEIPADRSWEIDDLRDFKVCEALLEGRSSSEGNRRWVMDCFSSVDALVFDFDGVFTDDRVWVDQDGRESVACCRSDGLLLSKVRRLLTGFHLLILSSEKNPVVTARARKLDIPVIHGVERKELALDQWLTGNGLRWNQVAYVGNERNDLVCLSRSKVGLAVANAHPDAKNVADFVLKQRGGDGAVREICTILLDSKFPEWKSHDT